MSTKTKSWLKAAAIRSIKTMAQTALGMMTLGMTAVEVDWINVLSVAVVAGAISILTSLEGLPEVSVSEAVAPVEVETAAVSEKAAVKLETEAE